jgi:hypothetical protein
MVTVNDILKDLGYPEDNNNYRMFAMNEGFSMEQLSDTDLAYYKRANNFVDNDKLVVVQDSEIVYIED